jgi:hypothetical protein
MSRTQYCASRTASSALLESNFASAADRRRRKEPVSLNADRSLSPRHGNGTIRGCGAAPNSLAKIDTSRRYPRIDLSGWSDGRPAAEMSTPRRDAARRSAVSLCANRGPVDDPRRGILNDSGSFGALVSTSAGKVSFAIDLTIRCTTVISTPLTPGNSARNSVAASLSRGSPPFTSSTRRIGRSLVSP